MRRVAFAVLSTVAGLIGLLSFKTESTGSVATSTGTTPASEATGRADSATTHTSTTVTGTAAQTQYGPIQVRITVSHGKVTGSTAVAYPSQDPRDAQINAYAIPILQQETVGATSASQVDMVSGATYTSEGYAQSLQSALDKAGL